jgi:hypothetical protein
MSLKNLAIFVNKLAGIATYTGQNYVWIKERDVCDVSLKTTATTASHQHLETILDYRERKGSEIWSDLCVTQALTNREWTKASTDLRHCTARIAVHDFLHRMC